MRLRRTPFILQIGLSILTKLFLIEVNGCAKLIF